MKKYDAIIIGSGQGGNPLAKKLAEKGRKVALVERRLVGGTCINDGCTPTKAMISSAKSAYLAKNSAELGVTVKSLQVNLSQVVHRKNDIVSSFRGSSEKRLKENSSIDLIFGEASFAGKKEMIVALNEGGETKLTAEHIFIDTGTRPAVPSIKGIEDVEYLTSTTILDITEVPQHLLIVGGGPIALELAQMFRRFGSEITIIEQSERILKKEDDDIAGEMAAILEGEDIAIMVESKVVNVKKVSGGIAATVKTGNREKEIICSHLLLAAGRKPNTDALNLGNAGVDTDERGYIQVNEKLETSAKGIYAIGDVNGGPKFTHISYNDHVIVFRNLMEKANMSTLDRMVPYCIFTDPQLGRIGESEKSATQKGLKFAVAKLPMKYVARGIETGETRGFMKAIVDPESKVILGAAILGAEGGEIMSMLQLAMMGGITYDKIRDGVFAHPTYAESLNNLFMTLDK